MKVKFRTFSGLAGDPHELLTARNEDGYEEHRLWNTMGLFKNWNLQRAKKKLLRKMELITGEKHIEDI